jgi:hypothetical protein
MLKLRLMMEDVAEKLFGRFLPQVEAQANEHCDPCTPWEVYGCCDWQIQERRYCWGCQQEQYRCTGHCPI